MDWYKQLNKSKYTPPSKVFRIVWPILYSFIATSLFFIIQTNKCSKTCLSIFIIQILLNLSWTFVFFKQKQIKVALLLIVVILILTIKNYIDFYSIHRVSAYLLIPYIIWLCVAFYLNTYIVMYN
jgi:benzodiazapine receptor